MAKGPYLALDRLKRHVNEAIDRIDRKITYHLARGDKVAMNHVEALRERRRKLEIRLSTEGAYIDERIRNIEHPPPPRRPKPQKARNGRREW